jgi:ABC-type Na+ transport system ATPase subunit NatA
MLYVHIRSVLVDFVLWPAVCCALAGMLQPTSGTAYIGGHNIRTNMSAIRESLGICPQFDILWPDITVAEHLQLYAVIKGATYAQAGMQAQQAAAEVSPAMHVPPSSVCFDTRMLATSMGGTLRRWQLCTPVYMHAACLWQ